GKDDWAFVYSRHRLDHLTSEKLWHGTHADNAGRSKRLNRLHEVGYRRLVLDKRLLKIGEVAARLDEETVDIEQSGSLSRFDEVSSILCHRKADQLGDAGRGGACSKKEETLLSKVFASDS